MRPRLLLVDDHPGFRVMARAVLEADGFDVVGEASDGRSAIEATTRLRPDVVLLDVQLPDLDGFVVCDRIAGAWAEENGRAPEIVLMSSRDRSAYRRRMATSPARGFVSKDALTGGAISALLAEDR